MGKHSSGKRAEKRSSLASARANLRESLSGLRQGIARFAHSVASAPGMKYLRHGARSVTSVGWAVGASVLLAALVSYLWGWVEAFFIGCAGAGALLIAIIWVIVPSPHKVSIRLPRQRIVAGQTAVGEITAENTSDRRARSGLIELPIASSAL